LANLADVLYFPNNGQFDAPQEDFTEGLLIDYRGFDANDITPVFEFGFGLAYTYGICSFESSTC
jgi:beta-glucosidase